VEHITQKIERKPPPFDVCRWYVTCPVQFTRNLSGLRFLGIERLGRALVETHQGDLQARTAAQARGGIGTELTRRDEQRLM
jgi:hypothetical protein